MTASTHYPPLSPAFAVNDAERAIEFYIRAFGAIELYRLKDPDSGKIGHAEITIKGALVMLSDEYPAFNKTPKTLGGTTVKISLICDDVDADYKRAVDAGAEPTCPLTNQFYGHRSGTVRDPFGHEWMLSQVIENVSPEEMQNRWNAIATKGAQD